MDKQDLLNKISFILQDLKSQHMKLTGNVERIPEIDLELFMANARYLVQHLEVLNKINGTSPSVKSRDEILNNILKQTTGVEEKGPQIQEKEQEIKGEFPYEYQVPQAPAPVKEKSEVKSPFVFPLENKQGVFAPELERKAALASSVLLSGNGIYTNDGVKREEAYVPPALPQPATPVVKATNVHEMITSMSQERKEPSLLNKLGNLPVKDIKKAIGLNEHLLFIKTLFNGDPNAYDRTLNTIDGLKNAEEAHQFLQEKIAGTFGWETKTAVAELFKNIVSRKFAGSK